MLSKLKQTYRKYHNIFSGIFLFGILIVWLVALVLKDYVDTTTATAISLGIIMLVLGFIQDEMIDIRKPVLGKIFNEQSSATEHLLSVVGDDAPIEAKMIEYDSDSVRPILDHLLRKGTRIHLLLQHPDSACSEYQQGKIKAQIQKYQKEYFDFKDLLTISYYNDTASLRGRLIDRKFISFGWYTYDRRRNKLEKEVWGHLNPVINASNGDEYFEVAVAFFDEVFKNLLDNSVPQDIVYNRFFQT